MHHSQLEYLIAIQRLQGENTGVKGTTLADYMNVSASYIVKLSAYAEANGYIGRAHARTVRLTPKGERVITEYLNAARHMESFLLSCGADKDTSRNDAIKSVCVINENARRALQLAQKMKMQTE